jgi:hypothetical protein
VELFREGESFLGLSQPRNLRMLIRHVSARRGCSVLLGAALVLGATGCGKEGPKLLPVEGAVTVGDQPLNMGTERRRGYVELIPDAARGNTSPELPRGYIDPEGRYKISTNQKPGAPPGWYRVRVDASDQPDPNNAYKFQSLVPQRYIDGGTTPLSIEVVESPAPGAYDLKLDAK